MGWDNPCVKVRGESQEDFLLAMRLAAGESQASHYKIAGNKMIVYWSAPESTEGASSLPYPMRGKPLADFVWNWFSTEANWPPEPDHDGSNSRGWYLDTGNEWGHVGSSFYSLFSLETSWLMHGK